MNKVYYLKILVIIAIFTTIPTLYGICWKIVNGGLCKVQGSQDYELECDVNCTYCPYDYEYSQACRKDFTVTKSWTDSNQINLGCDIGNDWDSCTTYTAPNDCSWTETDWECPSTAPIPIECIPEEVITTEYGPLVGVIKGSVCESGGSGG